MASFESDLGALRTAVRGTVVVPGDASYDADRSVWNAMVEARPLVLVRAASTADIAPTIAFARARGLDLAVRGGGHNVAGKGTVDDGIVLDLGALTEVAVETGTGLVRVQGGATLAQVDAATAPHGLAVPLGVVSGTGVGGLTLGGGIGWLTRKHGLTADNLVSATIVTSDGATVRATTGENPDLLWALRGGGGNFGVVSEFTLQGHSLGPDVLTANLIYSMARWRDAWRAVETWTADLPDAMTMITTTITPPPIMEMGDRPLLIVGCAWASENIAAGEAHIKRLSDLCTPDEALVGLTPWVELQSSFDPVFPKGVRAYWRNTSFDRLDDAVIDILVGRGAEQTWLGTAFDVHHLGGAFARTGPESSPFPSRGARFWINMYGFWDDSTDDGERVAFVRAMSADMQPHSTGGHYMNFQGFADGHRELTTVDIFGAEAAARLAAVKRRFDPENVFHVNQNIAPA